VNTGVDGETCELLLPHAVRNGREISARETRAKARSLRVCMKSPSAASGTRGRLVYGVFFLAAING
jgi:hypothetical protein